MNSAHRLIHAEQSSVWARAAPQPHHRSPALPAEGVRGGERRATLGRGRPARLRDAVDERPTPRVGRTHCACVRKRACVCPVHARPRPAHAELGDYVAREAERRIRPCRGCMDRWMDRRTDVQIDILNLESQQEF